MGDTAMTAFLGCCSDLLQTLLEVSCFFPIESKELLDSNLILKNMVMLISVPFNSDKCSQAFRKHEIFFCNFIADKR